jgi:sarcosine oxidase subunit gamma
VTVEQLTLGERRSPLSGFQTGSPETVQLAEVPFLTMVNLRVDPAGPAARRVASVLGAGLPTEPNTVVAAGAYAVLWLGPDEWLVVGPDAGVAGAAALVSSLREALDGERGSAVDVSANRTTIEVGGPRARDVLENGCPLDLHPRVFHPGRCAQTVLARAQVVLWQTGSEPTYRLLVRGSFAAYLSAWLADAAREHLL